MEYAAFMSEALSESTFWILTALTSGRRHGYGILQQIKETSNSEFSLKVTTLYAALERLERSGLVVNDGEEIVEGRARRYFKLTEQGTAALGAEVQRLEARAHVARQRLAAGRVSPAHSRPGPVIA